MTSWLLSEAACSLRQLLLKLSPPQYAAQSSRATNDHPSSEPSFDAATEPTAATDPAVPNDVPDDQPEQQDSCQSSPSQSHETCSSKLDKHLSPALKLRADEALEASTTMLANLSARLEAFVYLQTGAHVQGNAACQAALDL